MAEVARAFVSIMPSMSGFTPALSREMGGPAERAGRESGDRAGRGFKGTFIAGLKGIAAPLAGIFAGAQVVGFFKDSVAAASGLNESLNALGVTYGEAASGIEELGRGAAQSLGLSNLEFNDLAVRFSSFAQTVAGEGGDVVGTVDDMTTRAADFASVMNLDVAQAAQIFQSSMAGESESIRQFGIDMSAAAVTAYALENGISTSASSMTESEKVQARYGLLMQETQQHAGDFADTSDSLANQQRILGAEFENTKASVGEQLLPAVQGLVNFATTTLLPKFDELVGVIVDDIVPGFEDFADTVEDWKIPLTAVAGVITAVFLPALIQMGVQQLIAGTKAVVGWAMQTAASIAGTAAQSVAVARVVAGWVVMGTQSLLQAGRMALAWFIALGPIGWVIAAIIGIAILVIANWDKIVAWTKQAWSAVTDWLKQAWENIKTTATNVWNAVLDFFRAIPGKLTDFFLNFTLPGLLIKHWDSIKQGATDKWNALVDYIKGIPGKIVTGLGNLGRMLIEPGKQLLQGLIDGIKDKVAGAVQAVKDAVGSVISGAKNLLGIASPSKVFMELGGYVGEGLAVGIASGRRDVQAATNRLMPSTPSVRSNLAGFGSAAAGSGPAPIDLTQRTIEAIASVVLSGATYTVRDYDRGLHLAGRGAW